MEQKNVVLVICETLAPEIEDKVPPHVEVNVIEFGLHLFPKELNKKLRDILGALDREGKWDLILLGYGLCSEGVVGLKSEKSKIVMPRTDDCIAIFLGSTEAYKKELTRDPGTYYLTKGWIEHGEDPLSISTRRHQWTKKYDEQTAQWVAREIMKNYTRIALIDTGTYELSPYIAYAKKVAETFDLKFEIIPGSLFLLEKLLHGPWDDNFLALEPGQEITKEMFLPKY
ncbi:MAG: DUF1638 domain-containing protein [Firmicutes bacterium]|nr:DUF1638 domain-containing protein [Bacillota bacterium]